MKVKNPIIKGFYADPSICYAKGKFYLICSTMHYFPGVPIFESEDLIHWKQIGNALSRPSQIELDKINSSGGVFAPTIRYNNGRFYMVTTNDTYHKNFYIYTDDIYGEWSEPIFVDQGGIDPSLFFENGKTYFISNGSDSNGRGCVFQCEIDIETGERLTPSMPIWNGNGGRYLESPHMYKFGNYYYLMAAEGGTEYGHMVTVSRSASITGPFNTYKNNPILSNKDLGGHESHIQGIGHADLVTNADGETFMVCLGFRIQSDWMPFHQLGREVFLVPITWDGEWFRAGVEGHVYDEMEINVDKMYKSDAEMMDYNFKMPFKSTDYHRMSYIRCPVNSNYDIKDDKISLTPTTITLDDVDTPTFLGVRQSEFNTEFSATFSGAIGEAGLTAIMDEKHHYEIARVIEENGEGFAFARFHVGSAIGLTKSIPIKKNDEITLKIISTNANYSFFAIINGEEKLLGEADSQHLSSEVAGGFTGVYEGVYSSAKLIKGIDDYKEIKNAETVEITELAFIQ